VTVYSDADLNFSSAIPRDDMGKPVPIREIELEPDAWERFERAVDVVVKSPPQHRTKANKAKPKRAKSPSARKRKKSQKMNADAS
jgi:hypothetical protein